MKKKHSFNLAKLRRNIMPPMSQRKLAEIVGISRSSIASYESGIYFPGPEIQKKISEILKAAPHKIFPIN